MSDAAATLDHAEIARFAKVSDSWWDEAGPFAPLHRLNPVRLSYLRRQIGGHYGLDARSLQPFTGLRLLDLGCGGGLTSEPLCRLGAIVTAMDADATAIATANAHAATGNLAIDYQTGTSEVLPATGFDIVLALEIVEHVADVPAFIAELKRLVKPGGLVIMSTLNRTPRSYLGAIVGAEYLLRWLPRGTHQWKRFLKPSELTRELRQAGLAVNDLTGMTYNPLSREFSLSEKDLAMNYFVTATAL